MKKDKAWIKDLINEEGIVMNMNSLGRHDEQSWKNENIKINKGRLFHHIDQLDEPEVEQSDKKTRELESYNDELIRDNNQLRNELDNQEVLSQEWIDENKVARIDNLRKMTTSDVVPVEKLKKLIVPNQEELEVKIQELIEAYKQEDGQYSNPENYWIDGFISNLESLLEKEPMWVVRYEDGYFSEEINFGCGIDGDWVDEVSRAYHFTDKSKAEAVALLIGGTVEEVTE